MSNEAGVRYIGATFRQAVASHYSVNGADFGYRVARRGIYEFAGAVAENHSRQDAVELLYRMGDRFSGGIPFAETVLGDEELLPGPRAALARIEAAPEPEPPPAPPSPPCVGPTYTFMINGKPATVQGDLLVAQADLRSMLDQIASTIAELHPAPPAPRWRRAIRWIDAQVSWQMLVAYFIGFVMGAA